MGNETKEERLEKTRLRYQKAGRKRKRIILDEFCATWGSSCHVCSETHPVKVWYSSRTFLRRPINPPLEPRCPGRV